MQPQFDENSLNNRNNHLSSTLSVDNASSLAAAASVSCTPVYTGQAHSSSVYLGMHGYTPPTVTWSSSVGAIAAPHLYRSPPAGICPVLPGHRLVLPAPAYGWSPYAIGAMPYVGGWSV